MARGRPKGALNKKTREALEGVKAAQLGPDGLSYPVRYLLSVVKNAKNPQPVRMQAARDAAPFVQPKLSAVDLNNRSPENMPTEAELLEQLKALLERNPQLALLVPKSAAVAPESEPRTTTPGGPQQ